MFLSRFTLVAIFVGLCIVVTILVLIVVARAWILPADDYGDPDALRGRDGSRFPRAILAVFFCQHKAGCIPFRRFIALSS